MHGEPERRVRVASESSAATYEKLRKLDDIFEAVAARGTCNAGPRVKCVTLSSDWFRASRTPPRLGRVFVRDDRDVVVLSKNYWDASHASNPAIIGQVVNLGEKKYTVVGIIGEIAEGDVYLPWTPAGDSISIIALLRPGVDLKKAQAATDALGAKVKLETYKAE